MTRILKTLSVVLNIIEAQIHWCAQQLLIPRKIKTCAFISHYFPLPSITLGSYYHYFNDSLYKWLGAFMLQLLRADLSHTHRAYCVSLQLFPVNVL